MFCYACGEKNKILYSDKDPGQKGRNDGESDHSGTVRIFERSGENEHVRQGERVCICMWREIEKALSCDMYFADPYCAWQKGTNENLNGLLREFYPKGRNLSRVSPATLKKNLALINARPKKVYISKHHKICLNKILSSVALSLTIHRNVCYNKGMKMLHLQNTAVRKHYTVNKNSSGCGSAKLLYAGELKKTANWKEEIHSHPFCEIVSSNQERAFCTPKRRIFPSARGSSPLRPKFSARRIHFRKGKTLPVFLRRRRPAPQRRSATALWTSDSPVLKTGKLKKDIEKTFAFLIREVQKKTYYYDEISRSLLKIILDLILRILAQNNGGNFKTNRSYLCARKYIDENYQNIESVEEICKSVLPLALLPDTPFQGIQRHFPHPIYHFQAHGKGKTATVRDRPFRSGDRSQDRLCGNQFLFENIQKDRKHMTPSEYRKKPKKPDFQYTSVVFETIGVFLLRRFM